MTGIQLEPRKLEIWHERNKQKLRELWANGLTAAEISIQIPGSTRNGVIGKAHRMGLAKRPKKDKTVTALLHIRQEPPRKRPNLLVTPQTIKPTDLEPPTKFVDFMQLGPRVCRAVMGHSKQGGHTLAFYCGNPSLASQAFCPYHHLIFYRRDT